MADNQIRRTGIAPGAKADGKSGYTVDPGPYEAIVVKQVEGSRSGQLMVYIPDWGGVQTDPKDQIVVSYASPFYGRTYGTNSQQTPNTPQSAGQSYGMWMVPPDVGNKVLVTFAAGDRSRGYWFACCYDSTSHHMVPGMAHNIGGNSDTSVATDIASYLTSDQILPVVEASAGQSSTFGADPTQAPRYPHEFQAMALIMQGLDKDPVRGAISSSSLREAPSNVYGISTPGRSATKNAQVASANNVEASQAVIARKGGHQFVMDDGDKDGNDQLIRLRTAGGHQILMNDVADKTDKGGHGVLYIASASGNQWLEFSSDGSINMFGIAGFNVRSKGALNFHSDSAVNINSGGSVNIHGEMGVKVDSLVSVSISAAISASVATDGTLKLSGVGSASLIGGASTTVSSIGTTNIYGATVGLNDPAPLPIPPTPIVPTIGTSLPDVTWGGTSWQYVPGAVQSICTVVPSHEPWIDPDTNLRPTPKSSGSALFGAAASLGAGAAAKLL
jgi:Type VI secretion system/phage-baseplate injector OB domain